MPPRTIEAPATDWLAEEDAVKYLGVNGLVFRRLVEVGYIPGIRRLSKQCVLYHWKGLLCALWRLELGDMPPEEAEESGEKRPKAAESREK